jgi:hypothetical protein
MLVAVSSSTRNLWHAYRAAALPGFRRIQVVCLRTSELYQLALPNPDPVISGISHWLRNEGWVLAGRDLRDEIPLNSRQSRLLGYQLDRFQAERHRILASLLDRRYDDLIAHLHRRRQMLAYSALLSKHIWQIYPHTIDRQFADAYDDGDLVLNTCEWRQTAREYSVAFTEYQRRALAFRLVWVYETLIRALWRHVE